MVRAKVTPKTIDGVLSDSPGGAKGRGSWSLVFELMPWQRPDDAKLPDVPLRIEIPVSESELDRWMNRLDEGASVRVELRRLHRPAGKPWWLGIGKLCNDGWRGNRPALTRDAFLERVRLSSIVVNADASATMYFSDGGLFLGHTIEVRVGKRGAISEVCLSG